MSKKSSPARKPARKTTGRTAAKAVREAQPATPGLYETVKALHREIDNFRGHLIRIEGQVERLAFAFEKSREADAPPMPAGKCGPKEPDPMYSAVIRHDGPGNDGRTVRVLWFLDGKVALSWETPTGKCSSNLRTEWPEDFEVRPREVPGTAMTVFRLNDPAVRAPASTDEGLIRSPFHNDASVAFVWKGPGVVYVKIGVWGQEKQICFP